MQPAPSYRYRIDILQNKRPRGSAMCGTGTLSMLAAGGGGNNGNPESILCLYLHPHPPPPHQQGVALRRGLFLEDPWISDSLNSHFPFWELLCKSADWHALPFVLHRQSPSPVSAQGCFFFARPFLHEGVSAAALGWHIPFSSPGTRLRNRRMESYGVVDYHTHIHY